MTDLVDGIRVALAPATHVVRVSAGFVPLPPHVRRPGTGSQGLIINCEIPTKLENEEAERVIELSRMEAVTILRALSARELKDTSSIAVRFGFYVGDRLRETAYACNLPFSYLSDAAARSDFRYWSQEFDVPYPTEYSSLGKIDRLLRPSLHRDS